MNDYVFALDIGTRTVNGILLKKEQDNYKLINHYSLEHDQRSMLDGQIHNVMDVAKVIQKVKEKLETDDNPLTSVYVAAAGRSLKTVRSSAEITLQQSAITDEEMVKHLELSAVHRAQESLSKENNENTYSDYHCVGYSVVHYHLDGERIGSLIDQQGETASVEVIATFLPKIVVDSLVAALKRAGLEMRALTLEPIAAIQVLIPESMRRLNVALVDIGAGTSDIAITDDGTVTAYGMVPIAGDEVTEILSDTYLLDYPLAEQMKCTIKHDKPATIYDILGFETTVAYDEFLKTISPTTEKLAESISKQIIKLNGTSPKAVMLIGGGSLTPHLPELLAEKLNLPNNRVAVRGVDALNHIQLNDDVPTGPDFITPIGIAVTAKEKPVHFLSAFINNQEVKMFEMNNLTIGDAFIQANIPIHQYYGAPGIAYIVKINDKEEMIPGTLGSPPTIFKNGEIATVDDPIQDGDEITVQKGADGLSPTVSIADYFGEPMPKNVYINQKEFAIRPKFIVNNQEVPHDYLICDKDKIDTTITLTVRDILQKYQPDLNTKSKDWIVTVNQERVHIPYEEEVRIYRNGSLVSQDQLVNDGDQIDIKHAKPPTIQTLLQKMNLKATESIQVTFNDSPVRIENTVLDIKRIKTNETLGVEEPLEAFDQLVIHEKEHSPFIFQDVFRYVEINLNEIGGRFTITVNDQAATFHTQIQNGDILSLKFED